MLSVVEVGMLYKKKDETRIISSFRDLIRRVFLGWNTSILLISCPFRTFNIIPKF